MGLIPTVATLPSPVPFVKSISLHGFSIFSRKKQIYIFPSTLDLLGLKMLKNKNWHVTTRIKGRHHSRQPGLTTGPKNNPIIMSMALSRGEPAL
jgi:hypothetical protein